MAKAVAAESPSGWVGRGWTSASGFLAGLAALTVFSLIALFTFFAAEQYLSESPRFRFRLAQMAGEEDSLRILGARYADADAIRAFFRDDHGRSIYRLPIEDRRKQVLAVKWVRDAAVIRRWPNGADVVVHERKPVAFVHLGRHRSEPPRIQLIDDAGELLPIPERTSFALPALLGLRADQRVEDRAARVHLMQFFLNDIAGMPVKVAEIDVADLRNVKCRLTFEGRTVLLLMGDAGFGANIRRFTDNWSEIQQRMPDAQVLDLRVPEHISAAPEQNEGGAE